VDPRATYNRALADQEAGALEAAARGFEATRSGTGTDGEALFRATYNLGWVEVARAETALDQEPPAALDALQRAADWFREAIALQPEHEASRRNLELVLRHVLVLADHLAQRGEEDLATRLIKADRGATDPADGAGAGRRSRPPCGTTPTPPSQPVAPCAPLPATSWRCSPWPNA